VGSTGHTPLVFGIDYDQVTLADVIENSTAPSACCR